MGCLSQSSTRLRKGLSRDVDDYTANDGLEASSPGPDESVQAVGGQEATIQEHSTKIRRDTGVRASRERSPGTAQAAARAIRSAPQPVAENPDIQTTTWVRGRAVKVQGDAVAPLSLRSDFNTAGVIQRAHGQESQNPDMPKTTTWVGTREGKVQGDAVAPLLHRSDNVTAGVIHRAHGPE